MKNIQDIEQFTAKLFPKIHSQSNSKDLCSYSERTNFILNKYSNQFNLETLQLIKDKSVLDVGCGGSASGIYALNQFQPSSITGVDLSDNNIQNTKEICAKLNINNANIVKGSALNLPFANDSFDFVFSNGVIHHTPDPYACFQELTRVLKPNGYLFLGIYGYGGLYGKILHPAGMLIGKIFPFKIAEKFVNTTGFLRSQENSILDWFYTPIQRKFKVREILNWFKENKLINTINIRSPKWFFNIKLVSPMLFGDGFIYAIGKKPNNEQNY